MCVRGLGGIFLHYYHAAKRENNILINYSFISLIHTFIQNLEYHRNYARPGENEKKQNVYFLPCSKNCGM